MTNTCSASGAYTKLIVQGGGSAPRTFTNSSERYNILAETLTKNTPLQGRRQITGDLAQYNELIRQHSSLVSGAIVMQIGPAQLDLWLPRILGAAGSGGVYVPGTSFPQFDVMIDRENAIFQYTDCVIARATFRSHTEAGQEASEEELLVMILDIFAVDERNSIQHGTAWPSPAPSLSLAANRLPYAHWEGVFEIGSDDIPYSQFELSIDNMMRPRFYNGSSPSCFRSEGRRVILQTNNPFTATTMTQALALVETADSATLTFTNDTLSTEFAFPALRNSYRAPSIRGKGEIPLQLSLECLATSSDPEVTITNDSTV